MPASTPARSVPHPAKVVFFHVLKTGGMTFRGMLSSVYGDSFHVCDDPSIDNIERALAKFDCLAFHTLPWRGDFVHMHAELARLGRWDLLEGAHVFTMLREPVEQAVSQYFDMVKKRAFLEPSFRANGVPFPESLEEFVERPAHFNNQLAFLAGKYQLNPKEPLGPADLEDVKEVLVRLNVHTCLTERYAESLHLFETVTGRRIPKRRVENENQSSNRLPLDAIPARLKERIREQSALDVDLYAFAREIFEREIAASGSAPVYTFGTAWGPQEHGYTIRPFLDVHDIQALGTLHAETTPVVPADYYVSAFGSDLDTKRRIFEGISAVLRDKVKRLAPGYRVLMASFVTKRAKSVQGRLGLHQDLSLVDHARHVGLNVWCPLSDVDNRNGCLRVVEGSHAFGHISATPPNPAPYDAVRGELEPGRMTEIPMAAGSAFLFDTRLLHATDDNQTDLDRTSVFLNLVPDDAPPRIYQWNREHPDKLEVYEVDSEFMLRFRPNEYMPDAERLGAKLVGVIDYKFATLTSADLPRILPARPPAPETAAPPKRGWLSKLAASARRL